MPSRERVRDRIYAWWDGLIHPHADEINGGASVAARLKDQQRVPPQYRDQYDLSGIHYTYRTPYTRLIPAKESQGVAMREIQGYALHDLEGVSPQAMSPEVAGMRDTLATVSDNILRLRLAKLYRTQRDDHNVDVLKATQKKQQGLELMERLSKQPFGNMLGDEVSWYRKVFDGIWRLWRATLIGAPNSANQRFYLNHRELVVENPNSTRDRVVVPITQIGSDYAISQDAPVWMNGINSMLVRFGGKQMYPFGLGLLNVIETGSRTMVGQIEIKDPEFVVDEIRKKVELLKAAIEPLPEAKPPITLGDLLVDPNALVPVTPLVHPRLKKDLKDQKEHPTHEETEEERQQRQMQDMLTLMTRVVSETVSMSVARTVAETLQAMGVKAQVDGDGLSIVPHQPDVVDSQATWQPDPEPKTDSPDDPTPDQPNPQPA